MQSNICFFLSHSLSILVTIVPVILTVAQSTGFSRWPQGIVLNKTDMWRRRTFHGVLAMFNWYCLL